MEIVLLTVGLMALAMGAMAVGVIFSNRELKGSCGGVGNNCPCAEAGTPGACKADPETAERASVDGVLIHRPRG